MRCVDGGDRGNLFCPLVDVLPAALRHSVEALRALGEAPAVGIVLGSGQGGLVDRSEVRARIPYSELGFPQTSVKGHAGELVLAELSGLSVVFLSGRIHLYEGGEVHDAVHAVRALALWGVGRMVLTCSVGSLTRSLPPGSAVVLEDHINLMGRNPLIGGPAEHLGKRFIDLSNAYDATLRADAIAAAASLDIELPQGVLTVVLGPSYETPAEIRMLTQMGGTVVGMSTVPEVIALAQLGVRTLALALVTNLAAGLSAEPLAHDEVIATAGRSGNRVAAIIEAVVKRWA